MTSQHLARQHDGDHTEDRDRGDRVGGSLCVPVTGLAPVEFINLSAMVALHGVILTPE